MGMKYFPSNGMQIKKRQNTLIAQQQEQIRLQEETRQQEVEQRLGIASRLGQQIKKIRQERKLTQSACSKQALLAKSHLCQIEAGKRVPSLEKLFDLCEVLCVKMADVFVCFDVRVEKDSPKKRKRPRSKSPI